MWITELKSDAKLRNQVINFLEQTALNADELGATLEEIELLTDNIEAFAQDMDHVVATQTAARSAVAAKNASRATLRAQIAQFSKTWRANPSISDATLAQLNVPPHQTPGNHSPTTTPTSLGYSVNTENLITLRWDANGNKKGTIYNVEASGDGTNWSVVRTTTSKKTQLTGVPGQTLYFRVIAIRSERAATPTQPIVVWPSDRPVLNALQVA